LVTLRYRGTAAAGVRPTRVFAQLVDDSTHWVLGNQITPIDLTLDGKTHTTHARMEVVTQWMAARHSTTLQLVATTVAYAAPRLGGSVSFERITIALPTTRPGALAKIGPGRAK
jgi:ABC-2 type transport system ATP-binding protein